jgi:hypothetical protein
VLATLGLHKWDGERLLRRMENRTLVFAGDSMAQLHFVSFGCLLMKSISYEPRIVEKTGIVNHEGEKMTGCIDVYFDQANFRIRFFRNNKMHHEGRLKYIMHGLTENDVCVGDKYWGMVQLED